MDSTDEQWADICCVTIYEMCSSHSSHVTHHDLILLPPRGFDYTQEGKGGGAAVLYVLDGVGWDVNRIAGADLGLLAAHVYNSLAGEHEVDFGRGKGVRQGRLAGREGGMGDAVMDWGRVVAGVEKLPQVRIVTRDELSAIVEVLDENGHR